MLMPRNEFRRILFRQLAQLTAHFERLFPYALFCADCAVEMVDTLVAMERISRILVMLDSHPGPFMVCETSNGKTVALIL